MVIKSKTLLSFIALIVLSLTALADGSHEQLRASSNYWGRTRRHLPVHITRLSNNRRLASVGDTIYMLDAGNRILWTWSSDGPPLTDLPIMDSRGTIYAIALDLTWVALDSKTGQMIWSGTGNGRAVYSQIGLYKGDVYFVVTDMEGYRDSLSDRRIKDRFSICKGNSIHWETDIPAGSRIETRGNKIVAVLKRNGRILRKLIATPQKFGAPIGKVSTLSDHY